MSMIQVFDKNGAVLEGLSIFSSVSNSVPSLALFSQAIRVLRQNWRQGTVACKTRGELAFSNKKPWRQKGTGRARVSSIRSPLWRKGGVIFGPQPRTRKLFIGKEQKRLVLQDLMNEVILSGRAVCFDFDFDQDKPSTKMAAQALKAAQMQNEKVVVLASLHDFALRASFGNIHNVSITSFDAANAFAFSYASRLVFMKKDVELFKKMVERWS